MKLHGLREVSEGLVCAKSAHQFEKKGVEGSELVHRGHPLPMFL